MLLKNLKKNYQRGGWYIGDLGRTWHLAEAIREVATRGVDGALST